MCWLIHKHYLRDNTLKDLALPEFTKCHKILMLTDPEFLIHGGQRMSVKSVVNSVEKALAKSSKNFNLIWQVNISFKWKQYSSTVAAFTIWF